jgi:hypothetical protein
MRDAVGKIGKLHVGKRAKAFDCKTMCPVRFVTPLWIANIALNLITFHRVWFTGAISEPWQNLLRKSAKPE